MCADTRAPTLTAKPVKARRGRLTFSGRARDITQCSAAAAGLGRIQVSPAKHSSKRCRYVNAKGRLGRTSSCAEPQFLTAKGTNTWTLTLRRPPAGRYDLRLRARDCAGNTTTTKARGLNVSKH